MFGVSEGHVMVASVASFSGHVVERMLSRSILVDTPHNNSPSCLTSPATLTSQHTQH